MDSDAARQEGVLASWDDIRGFGYITPATGGERVFAHIRAWARDAARPQQGDVVTFETELVAVARMLDIPDDTVAAAMQVRPASDSAPQVELVETSPTQFHLLPGDLIVLTGDMARSRDDWQSELQERGFVPWDAVTKKVKLVAAADPDSLSGKARNARDYGIPIMSEAGLAELLAR